MSTTELQIPIEAVVATLEEIVGRRQADPPPRVTPSTPLTDLALDSLDVVELFLALEELAGCELEPPGAGWTGVVDDLLRLRPAA